MNAKASVSLTDRHHLNGIDVNVFRQRRYPPYGFSNIFRRQRVGIFVGFTGFCIVTLEADVGELGAADQTWLNIRYANGGAVQSVRRFRLN